MISVLFTGSLQHLWVTSWGCEGESWWQAAFVFSSGITGTEPATEGSSHAACGQE